MSTVTIQEAQAHLAEWIDKLAPGEELVITRDDQPVAKLVGEPRGPRPKRKLGFLKGSVLYMADDFDATPEEFAEPPR